MRKFETAIMADEGPEIDANTIRDEARRHASDRNAHNMEIAKVIAQAITRQAEDLIFKTFQARDEADRKGGAR